MSPIGLKRSRRRECGESSGKRRIPNAGSQMPDPKCRIMASRSRFSILNPPVAFVKRESRSMQPQEVRTDDTPNRRHLGSRTSRPPRAGHRTRRTPIPGRSDVSRPPARILHDDSRGCMAGTTPLPIEVRRRSCPREFSASSRLLSASRRPQRHDIRGGTHVHASRTGRPQSRPTGNGPFGAYQRTRRK